MCKNIGMKTSDYCIFLPVSIIQYGLAESSDGGGVGQMKNDESRTETQNHIIEIIFHK